MLGVWVAAGARPANRRACGQQGAIVRGSEPIRTVAIPLLQGVCHSRKRSVPMLKFTARNYARIAQAALTRSVPVYAHFGITHRCNLTC